MLGWRKSSRPQTAPGVNSACGLILFLITLLFGSCDTQEAARPQVYYGPFQQAENFEMFYSENEAVKVRMTAPLVEEQLNGDREFPEGLHVEFLNEQGQLGSTLKANYAFYDKKEELWRAQGNVEVKNLEKNEQLNTEELFWKPSTKKIFTESFVTIRMATEVIYGKGLEANEDFSSYNIKNPQGEFEVAD